MWHEPFGSVGPNGREADFYTVSRPSATAPRGRGFEICPSKWSDATPSRNQQGIPGRNQSARPARQDTIHEGGDDDMTQSQDYDSAQHIRSRASQGSNTTRVAHRPGGFNDMTQSQDHGTTQRTRHYPTQNTQDTQDDDLDGPRTCNQNYDTRFNSQDYDDNNQSQVRQRHIDEYDHDTVIRAPGRSGGGGGGARGRRHVRAIFDGADDTDEEVNAALAYEEDYLLPGDASTYWLKRG